MVEGKGGSAKSDFVSKAVLIKHLMRGAGGGVKKGQKSSDVIHGRPLNSKSYVSNVSYDLNVRRLYWLFLLLFCTSYYRYVLFLLNVPYDLHFKSLKIYKTGSFKLGEALDSKSSRLRISNLYIFQPDRTSQCIQFISDFVDILSFFVRRSTIIL